MTARRTARAIALVTCALLLLGACGDDDAAEGVVDADVGEVAEDDMTEEAAAALGEDCAWFGTFAGSDFGTGEFQDAFDPETMAGGDQPDLGGVFAVAGEQFTEAAAAAPEEVADDLRVMADTFSEAASELDGIEFDVSDPENIDPEAFAAFAELEELFGAEYEAAVQEVESFASENCSG